MKKIVGRTAAISLACFATSAMAQMPPDRWPAATTGASNVTIYGLADSGVEYLTNVNAAGASLTRMPTLAGSFPSNIGFRGSEDLGNGLKALYNLEMGYSVDGGVLQNGGRLFGRSAWVGLQGNFGTLMLGRMINMTYIANLRSNVMGPSIHSYPNLDGYLPNARSDNTIGYLGKFSNVTVGATFSTGRDATSVVAGPGSTACGGELATDSKACRQVTAMLAYDTPKYGMAASYDVLNGGPNAGFGLNRSDYDDRRVGINGYVVVDKLRIGGGIIERATDAAIDTETRLMQIGASYPVAPSVVVDAQVAKLDVKNSGNDSTIAVLRATYSFSRRTATYVSLARMKNEGTAAISVSAGGTVGPGLGQTGLMVGLRHAF
ncbi:MAG: porin [Pseudomonadota bacterium]